MTTETETNRTHLHNCADFMEQLTKKIKGSVSPGKILTASLKLLCRFCRSIPYVGATLTSVKGMLPDEDSKKVISLLQNLSEEIKMVRHDISELETKIKWEAVKLQYCDVVTKIELGMEYLSHISKPANVGSKINFEKRLKKLCSNESMTLALKHLVKGLTGEGLFHNNILVAMHRETRGDRGKVQLMCIRFLQLFSGGLAVIAAYETLERGEDAALEMKAMFEIDSENLSQYFEAVQKMCKDCFIDFMREDLRKVLNSDKPNKEAVAFLSIESCERSTTGWRITASFVAKTSSLIITSAEINSQAGNATVDLESFSIAKNLKVQPSNKPVITFPMLDK